jgi:transmembrane sensor
MKREELIQKWLDHALMPQELEAFKQLEDYEELTKLHNALQSFKAPEANVEAVYETVTSKRKNTSKPTSWLKPLQISSLV